jgi:DNA-binding CsgD family transcriptional regulator
VALTTTSEPRLWGRRAECDQLDTVLANARAGWSGSLVVRGEAGVGKTALLDYILARAAGCRVVRAAGVEAEMELAFAGLHLLCAPFLDRLERLPPPQRDALGIAFGLLAGAPPDRFLVGLAVLSLLSDVAETQPLVCLVDDAQWLDQASGQVLGFVARRLAAESVVIIIAVREPGGTMDLTGLQELRVGPLHDPDARALLASAIPGRLDDSVRDRIVAEARGNPLALLELPRAWTPAAFAGGFGLPDGATVAGWIEESFRRRLVQLPDDSRRLLLVAAAEPVGDPVLIWDAVDHLGIPREASEPATATGLLDVGSQVRFRHPLVRSVVYREAPLGERRMVHEALAEATDPEQDPDRRVWHLATAASGPDEDVALELERSAGRAQSRGGLAAAAAFLQRALALTRDPTRRAERALAAAEASLKAGEFDAALELVAAAEVGALDPFQHARVDLLHAQVAYAQGRGGDAPPLLLRAAQKLEPLDAQLSRDTYLEAWGAALFAGGLASSGGLLEVSTAARNAPGPADPPRPCDLLLDGLALVFTDGRAAATPVLQRAIAGFAGEAVSVEEVLRWGWLATAAAAYLWDLDASLAIAARGVDLGRSLGALEVLTVSLNVLAQAVGLSGDFAKAALLIAEADAVREATGTQVGPYGALVHAALRGREPAASELIRATIRDATAGSQGTAVQYAHWSNAVLMNGLGRYDQALAAAIQASDDTPELFVSAWATSELIEAANRSHDTQRATLGLQRLVEHTRGTDADWALGLEARARALLAEGDVADEAYREAIDRLSLTKLRPEAARTRLLYGEWLRREGRRVDAREQLRIAHDAFSAMGMEAFAERTRRELSATGEIVRKRSVDTLDQLTTQEVQIARLASDGRTNPEIGAQLYLSPRTVEWHLRKVFAKLGVASRKELHKALAGATPAGS